MTDDDPDAQDREIGDLAADMREHGRSWADIAHDLALPEATVKRAVLVRLSNSAPSIESSMGSDRPDGAMVACTTKLRFCNSRTTLFIACGETLIVRANCALDMPGDCDNKRMHRY
ncbi:uncharacterized protein PO1_contig-128-6 [Mycobacterium sp. PO1]|nr:uncharacterized protein PO1_contig-128-6 [Mycobacterium sp. PO1]GFM26582.1 uncharacterized protein PO2_contig-099-7 [Mycobacterium sp. PO2]